MILRATDPASAVSNEPMEQVPNNHLFFQFTPNKNARFRIRMTKFVRPTGKTGRRKRASQLRSTYAP
jgi:hypothetical protein